MAWYDENLDPIVPDERPAWADAVSLAAQVPDEQRMRSVVEACVAVDGGHGNGPGDGGTEVDTVHKPSVACQYAPFLWPPRVAAPGLMDMFWSEMRLLTRWVGLLWCEACVWVGACRMPGLRGWSVEARREVGEY